MDKSSHTTPSVPLTLPFHPTYEQKWTQKSPTDSDLRDIIRQMGLKFTNQRFLILKAIFSGSKKHITAQSLFEKLNEEEPSLGFATVYRFLRALTQHGYMLEVRMGGSPARYELTPHKHHDHLTCIYCGQIEEFEDDEIEKLQEEVSRKNKYILVHHILELYGVCSKPSCRKRYAEFQKKK